MISIDYNFEDYIPDALAMVSAWEVEEEHFADVVNDQARLMAGFGLEPSGSYQLDDPYQPLSF